MERAFVVSVLFLFSGALIPTLAQWDGSASTGPLLRLALIAVSLMSVFFLFVYLFSAVSIVVRASDVARTLWRNWPILALVGFALTSTLWSDVPGTTLRQSVALVGTTMFGIYLGMRFSLRQQLQSVALVLAFCMVLSVATSLLFPSWGVDTDGNWQGAFVHKNMLGRLMALSTIVFLLLPARGLLWHGIKLGCIIASIALLLLAGSKTGLTVLLILVGVLLLSRPLRWHFTLTVPIFVGLVAVGGYLIIWLLGNAEPLLGAMGKDVTLTGRTELWGAVQEQIRQRPLLGAGYSAFWLGWDGPSAYVWALIGWESPHSHNGFLDLALELGALGIVMFALSLGQVFVRALDSMRWGDVTQGAWPLIYVTYLLLYNLTESTVLNQNDIFWSLYVSTSVSLLLQSRRRRGRQTGVRPLIESNPGIDPPRFPRIGSRDAHTPSY